MSDQPDSTQSRGGFSGLQVLAIVLFSVLTTVAATVWIVRTYVFPSEFTPVELSAVEQEVLEKKIDRLGGTGPTSEDPPSAQGSGKGGEGTGKPVDDQAWLDEGAYDEGGSDREVVFTERELNALIAGKTDMGRRAAIDLSDDLASARVLIPVDPDFPVLGGRTLRVSAGLELAYAEGRPIVALRGVSLMGVPIPNAWLGNLKNVDLVERYGGGDGGFWQAFAAGVDEIQLDDGRLKVRLRE